MMFTAQMFKKLNDDLLIKIFPDTLGLNKLQNMFQLPPTFSGRKNENRVISVSYKT